MNGIGVMNSGLLDIIESLEYVVCDLCGQINEEVIYTRPETLTGYSCQLVRCRSCGLIYQNPRMSAMALAKTYDGNYYNGKGSDFQVNYLSAFEQATDTAFRQEIVRAIRELVSPPAKLLDFGCGLGNFMRQAIKCGYTTEGFEVSRFAAGFARSKGFNVYTNPDDIPTDYYDIVTAIEVVEHSPSPMKTLKCIYSYLKRGGYFYYMTANFDGFYQKWRKGIKNVKLDDYMNHAGHIYFFSTPVMKSYLEKIGFSRVFQFESKYYEREGRLFRLLSKLHLLDTIKDLPTTFLEKLFYYGGRRLALRLGWRQTLPFARK